VIGVHAKEIYRDCCFVGGCEGDGTRVSLMRVSCKTVVFCVLVGGTIRVLVVAFFRSTKIAARRFGSDAVKSARRSRLKILVFFEKARRGAVKPCMALMTDA
jgi:hypothetical protein